MVTFILTIPLDNLLDESHPDRRAEDEFSTSADVRMCKHSLHLVFVYLIFLWHTDRQREKVYIHPKGRAHGERDEIITNIFVRAETLVVGRQGSC